jgi:hypothetical protein
MQKDRGEKIKNASTKCDNKSADETNYNVSFVDLLQVPYEQQRIWHADANQQLAWGLKNLIR